MSRSAVPSAHEAAGAEVADSARLTGTVTLGRDAMVAQGTHVWARGGAVSIGGGSAVLENSVVAGWPEAPVRIGRRTVFGHRALVVGATVGDLCEIGNGAILLPGARLGDRVFLSEGALVPPGVEVPDEAVVVGRPGRRIRRATDDDLARLAGLRGGDLSLPDDDERTPVVAEPTRTTPGRTAMGTLYEYRGRRPEVGEGTVVADSAELTGDVRVGRDALIGPGVRIIGDSHGPVRIGDRVQILSNAVLHLLPDNELVLGDDVVVGPGCMIHGCHIGDATVIEPGAIVCDWAELGAGSLVRAGANVVQRRTYGDGAVLEGFPAQQVDTLDAPPDRPPWALEPADVAAMVVVEG